MTAAYRAKFTTLIGDTLIDEMPLAGVSLETRLGAAGAMSASIPIARGDYATGRRIAAIKASGASAITVYRNGTPWWGGPLWNKTPTSDQLGNPSVPIQAATFESYLDRVQLGADLAPMLATDQLAIARSLIADMQSDANSNIGLTYDPALLSGILRDRTQYLASGRDGYLKMLTDLAGVDGGFEFTIQILADPVTGARTRYLRLGYPTLATGVVHRFDKPGSILSYSWPEDGTRAATYLMAQGSSILSGLHTNTAAIGAGYPRLDLTTSYSSVIDSATLEAHATADLAAAAPPVVVPTVTVRLDATDLTPQSLGDTVKVHIQDELFPDGATWTGRLVGVSIKPPQKGQPEFADLILN